MTTNRVSSYVEQLAVSQALVARALRAYRAGLITEAWRIARKDPLMVPGSTELEWMEWAASIVNRERERTHEQRERV